MGKKNGFDIKLHPSVLSKDGRKQFVVLPYEEFVIIQQRLEDAQDLMELRKAMVQDDCSAGLTLDALKKELGIKKRRKVVKKRKARGNGN